jgi:hypothetical protein
MQEPCENSRRAVPKRITEIVAAVRAIEDLKGLTEEEFTWLATHGTEKFGNDGDFIFSQGTPPHHLMFILSGEVIVHRHSSSPVFVLIGQTGRITGKTPFSRIKAWNADIVATGQCASNCVRGIPRHVSKGRNAFGLRRTMQAPLN